MNSRRARAGGAVARSARILASGGTTAPLHSWAMRVICNARSGRQPDTPPTIEDFAGPAESRGMPTERPEGEDSKEVARARLQRGVSLV